MVIKDSRRDVSTKTGMEDIQWNIREQQYNQSIIDYEDKQEQQYSRILINGLWWEMVQQPTILDKNRERNQIVYQSDVGRWESVESELYEMQFQSDQEQKQET